MTATRILGIDPGSRVTGFGVIDWAGQRTVHCAHGVVKAGTGVLTGRPEAIFAGIKDLIGRYQPAVIAVERVFVAHNADSALKLGHARAAAICASFGHDVGVHEYAAREIKQAIVGRGGAEKAQVQHMVRVLLNIREDVQADAADALAVAICHAHTFGTRSRIAAQLGAAR